MSTQALTSCTRRVRAFYLLWGAGEARSWRSHSRSIAFTRWKMERKKKNGYLGSQFFGVLAYQVWDGDRRHGPFHPGKVFTDRLLIDYPEIWGKSHPVHPALRTLRSVVRTIVSEFSNGQLEAKLETCRNLVGPAYGSED